MRYLISAFLLALLSLGSAWGAVKGETVTYKAGNTVLKGYLAYDDAVKGKRPGVLVVHEWWGVNDYVKRRTRMLAELGYTALAVDMYGDGKVVTTPDEAKALSGKAYSNIAESEKRFRAGFRFLKKHSTVNSKKVAAVGYCFGGGMALEMARAGVNLKGVASFHGGLGTSQPAQVGKVKARILVMTGAADSFVPPDQVAKFEQEMKRAKVNYRLISYPNSKHAFTNPDATELGKKFNMPIEYNADADRKSWAEMQTFLKQVL